MPLSEEDKALDRIFNQGHAGGVSLGLGQGDSRTCKTVWETFKANEDLMRENGMSDGLFALDQLKRDLIEVLPYGPDEVN